METTLTRKDCERDNVMVICPNATLLGFGTRRCKRGNWVVFEQQDLHWTGRVIGRVRCEGKTYIEVATAAPSMCSVYIRWIEPHEVKEIRPVPPKSVFDFLARDDWNPADVFKAMEYGVSDLKEQLAARSD